MKILAIGDIIGKPGRDAVKALLPGLKQEYDVEMVIANAENVAGGIGLTPATADELMCAGAVVLTSGYLIWAQKEFVPYMESNLPVLRPLNYPAGAPGRGYLTLGKVAVVNLIGRTFMGNFDCPFRAMDKLLSELPSEIKVVIIDFHAEATSEKMALGYYLDGRVSAVLGTHTHVATVDTRLLPRGTAYVTDIGMVGPVDSVIGDDVQSVIQRFLSQIPHRLSVAGGKRVTFNAVMLEVDETTGKASRIERLHREVEL